MLRLYDTATREVRELATREPGVVGIYLCGPTVYGPPHIGHGRATMEYDVLARYLRWRGLQVRLVSNVTDIDDAIINRANREQRPWDDIAQKCERVWFNAMDGINVARPDDIPHATQYVDDMVALIRHGVDTLGHGAVAWAQFAGATFLSAILDNNIVADFASRALENFDLQLLHLFAMAQIAGYALGGCWTHIGSAQSVVAYSFIQRDVDAGYTPLQWIREMTPVILEMFALITIVIAIESWLL